MTIENLVELPMSKIWTKIVSEFLTYFDCVNNVIFGEENEFGIIFGKHGSGGSISNFIILGDKDLSFAYADRFSNSVHQELKNKLTNVKTHVLYEDLVFIEKILIELKISKQIDDYSLLCNEKEPSHPVVYSVLTPEGSGFCITLPPIKMED